MAHKPKLLFKVGDEEERSLQRTGSYIPPLPAVLPTMERLQQLFRVVNGQLHWYIDPTHTAPTGEGCNIDGAGFSREWILNQLAPPLPSGIHMTPSGTFRARYTHNGKQVHLGYFKTMEAAVNAINAINALKEAA